MYKCNKKKYTLEEAKAKVYSSFTNEEGTGYVLPTVAKYFCKRCDAYHVAAHIRRRVERFKEKTYARYLEIVRLYSIGLRSEQIAKKLGVTLPTVRAAFVMLCNKFKATNITHLTAILLREKLIQ